MKNYIALLQMNTAVFLFGLSAILAVQMSVHPVMIVWGRSFFALIALFFIMALRWQLPWKGRTTIQVGKLGLAGLILGLHLITFFLAVYYGGVVLTILSFASFPAFVIVLNALQEKAIPRLSDVFVVILIIIGMILVTPSMNTQYASLAGLVWGLTAGFLYAVIILANKILTVGIPAMAACWWQYLTVVVLLGPIVTGDIPQVSLTDWLWLILSGLLNTALAFTLFLASLPMIKASEVAVISAMEPVYAIAMAWVFLGEEPVARTICGGVIIIATVFWSSIKSNRAA